MIKSVKIENSCNEFLEKEAFRYKNRYDKFLKEIGRLYISNNEVHISVDMGNRDKWCICVYKIHEIDMVGMGKFDINLEVIENIII